MKKNLINLNFRDTLLQKIPERGQLVNILIDTLDLERESIYRRLRGEVAFSFEEVVLISRKLGISVDQELGIIIKKQHPFLMEITDFENPPKEDIQQWENYNNMLLRLIKDGPLHTFETWTTIPFPFCFIFPNLARFYIFKWDFQLTNPDRIKRFDEFQLDERILELGLERYELYRQTTSSDFILTNFVFRDLLKDICFFHQLNVISDSSLQLLITEIETCIEQFYQLTIYGKHEHSDRKVKIHITDLNVDSTYTLIESEKENICCLHTFTVNSLMTRNQNTYNCIKNSFTSLRRLSTDISISGEKERLRYVRNEKVFIDEIKNTFFPPLKNEN